MDFDDCGYQLQQVAPRSRKEKVVEKDRDLIEKSRLITRVESHIRYSPYGNIVKPYDESSLRINDVDRFSRDYTVDQRATKRKEHDRLLGRAASRHIQQVDYEHAIEERRKEEAADFAKVMRHCSAHDFGRESVHYDPVTNTVPPETTEKGASQRILDATRETFREARARRIQHMANSTPYDPVTGGLRSFW
jgi:hypothetical protein